MIPTNSPVAGPNDDMHDDAYFDDERQRPVRVFDAKLIREPLTVLPTRKPLVFSPESSVADAVNAMQSEHRGCVIITQDGTPRSPVIGIFTERDILFRIVGRGRNPATLALAEVMTPDPERLSVECSIAWVLNKMSVGGFRHVTVVDDGDCPVCVLSVRDVVDFLVDHFPGEVLNLPPEFELGRQREREGA
jgi:CBS domain-containing protein